MSMYVYPYTVSLRLKLIITVHTQKITWGFITARLHNMKPDRRMMTIMHVEGKVCDRKQNAYCLRQSYILLLVWKMAPVH